MPSHQTSLQLVGIQLDPQQAISKPIKTSSARVYARDRSDAVLYCMTAVSAVLDDFRLSEMSSAVATSSEVSSASADQTSWQDCHGTCRLKYLIEIDREP